MYSSVGQPSTSFNPSFSTVSDIASVMLSPNGVWKEAAGTPVKLYSASMFASTNSYSKATGSPGVGMSNDT